MKFRRPHAHVLEDRFAEQPAQIIVVSGPRQVGKSTMVRDVLNGYSGRFLAADQQSPELEDFSDNTPVSLSGGAPKTPDWIIQQWSIARAQASALPDNECFVLAIDEIQKIPRWSEVVKGLWDEDRGKNIPLHIVLLGSSPWLMQRGLTESLAGRYELLPMTHWNYSEMQQAFDLNMEEYIFFGGYPGSAQYMANDARWRSYIRHSLIDPIIDRDILEMVRIDKPALLRNLFELGCAYSGQIISYTKLVGQLQDAGNTTTLANYLQLLQRAGLLAGLDKFAGEKHRQRASSPKLNALNTALMTALGGYNMAQAKADRSYWGRLVESAVGAHIYNTAPAHYSIHYWRESPHEVDFIIQSAGQLLALEVKSGDEPGQHRGLAEFTRKYAKAKTMLVGPGHLPIAEFLSEPIEYWVENS